MLFIEIFAVCSEIQTKLKTPWAERGIFECLTGGTNIDHWNVNR